MASSREREQIGRDVARVGGRHAEVRHRGLRHEGLRLLQPALQSGRAIGRHARDVAAAAEGFERRRHPDALRGCARDVVAAAALVLRYQHQAALRVCRPPPCDRRRPAVAGRRRRQGEGCQHGEELALLSSWWLAKPHASRSDHQEPFPSRAAPWRVACPKPWQAPRASWPKNTNEPHRRHRACHPAGRAALAPGGRGQRWWWAASTTSGRARSTPSRCIQLLETTMARTVRRQAADRRGPCAGRARKPTCVAPPATATCASSAMAARECGPGRWG